MIEFLDSADKSFFLFLNGLHADWLNPIMVKLSGQLFWFPVLAYFLYVGFQRFGRRQFSMFILFIIFAMVAADVTSSQILKNIFGRLRPCRQDDLKLLMHQFGQKCGGRFGFVSSHASNSFAAIIFIIQSLELKRTTKVIALAFPALVSFSRIYLGVHFPGDIIGGTIVGVFWGLFFAWVFQNLQGAKR